jgi:putative oxidoreductase
VSDDTRLRISLLVLRLGVALVFLFWSLDKLLHPEHAGRVFEAFYRLPGLGPSVFAVFGVGQLILVIAFALGVAKRFTYAAVLVLHGISTASSYRQYLDPFANLLFFAAWPMLAACLALYLLRDSDSLGVLPPRRGAAR